VQILSPDGHNRRAADERIERVLAFVEEYQPLLKALAEREVNSAKLRSAIIEKTLTGLMWAALAGIGSLVWSALKGHSL
jgi:hypothetical protein